MGQGGVPLCRAEVFERAWALDSFRRAGLEPHNPAFSALLESICSSWQLNTPGLAYSETFALNDGDCTAIGYAVFNWASMSPSDEPLLSFWNGDHFRTYHDERGASISANLHALAALRTEPDFRHRQLAEQLTGWLASQMRPDVVFADKWHMSPYYTVGRAIHAFSGWDDAIASRCLNFILDTQRHDGGWGWYDHSTQEESAYCTIGLCHASDEGLLADDAVLVRAAQYWKSVANEKPMERLWIGKALYRPEALLVATAWAAKTALARRGYLQVSLKGDLAA
jgi:halimadienyl-diphosphate synthase